MTAPPWGHKPPAVDDPERYWGSPPPRLSARYEYWLRRWREGSWRPNKYLRSEDRHGRAAVLGIYVWEVLHVLGPLIDEYEQHPERPVDWRTTGTVKPFELDELGFTPQQPDPLIPQTREDALRYLSSLTTAIRFLELAREESKRTLVCPPHVADAVRTYVAAAGLSHLFEVRASDLAPIDKMIVINLNAVEGATRSMLQRRWPWERP